ncbi:unnamed protein product [Parajaminaea phylloscopi]
MPTPDTLAESHTRDSANSRSGESTLDDHHFVDRADSTTNHSGDVKEKTSLASSASSRSSITDGVSSQPTEKAADSAPGSVDPSVSLSRVRSTKWADETVSKEAPAASICPGGPSCPEPASLCRQASRASNRPPSPQFPSIAPALSMTTSAPGAVYIDWEDGDPANPMNWSSTKKWIIVMCCFCFTGATSVVATGFNAEGPQVEKEFGISHNIYLLGNTSYLVAVAFAPLVLAPFSELVGRKIIFNISALLFAILMIPQALASNIYGIHLPRIIQGAVASCGNSVTGGIVADCFASHDRSLPMSAFALVVFIFQGLAPPLASYTVLSHSWRVSFWWQGAVGLLSAVSMLICFDETRGPVLLSRRAAKMTKECGGKVVYRCKADDERRSVGQMVKTSITRPILYLCTEPIVISFSLWIGLLWGAIFMCVGAVPISFTYAYGWTPEQGSLVLLILPVGGFLGWLLNFIQERLYSKAWHRHNGQPPPETRLYLPAAGAVAVPVGLFWFAWSCRSPVHPVAPILGLICFAAGVFPIYMGVFVYLADCFRWYSSSALAAQSFMRNLLAGVLCLAVPKMYYGLTPPVASSVTASIAAVLGLTPFILLMYGAKIRAVSPIARALQKEEEEIEEERRRIREREARRLAREAHKAALAAERGDDARVDKADGGRSAHFADTTSAAKSKTTGERLLEMAMEDGHQSQPRVQLAAHQRDVEKQ